MENIIYDPWNSNTNILLLIKSNTFKKSNTQKKIKVIGPINKNGLREEITINLNYKNNIDTLFISSDEINFELRIVINLHNKSALINRIEKFTKNNIEFYSGSDIMKLCLKILKDMGLNEINLEDKSTLTCEKRLNNENFNYRISMLFTKTIPYSIVSLFKNGITFYMKFGFLPYIESINISNNIKIKFDKLKNIKWDEIEYILHKGNTTIKLIENGIFDESIYNKQKPYYFDKEMWKKYWIIITKSYNSFYERYKDKYDSPFKALENFDYKDCKMFINWLELYSLSSRFFDIVTYVFYKNNGTLEEIEIPHKIDILEVIELLRKVEWKINNLQEYSDIFNKLRKHNDKNILINIDILSYNI